MKRQTLSDESYKSRRAGAYRGPLLGVALGREDRQADRRTDGQTRMHTYTRAHATKDSLRSLALYCHQHVLSSRADRHGDRPKDTGADQPPDRPYESAGSAQAVHSQRGWPEGPEAAVATSAFSALELALVPTSSVVASATRASKERAAPCASLMPRPS